MTAESETPLVLVSNRGPVTFQPGGEIKRGTGGLVTALIGLASHRPVTWVASAMTDEDVAQSDRHDGRPFPVRTSEGEEYRVKLVASDPDAYDAFYKRLITTAPLSDVSSSFAMECIKSTTALPL